MDIYSSNKTIRKLYIAYNIIQNDCVALEEALFNQANNLIANKKNIQETVCDIEITKCNNIDISKLELGDEIVCIYTPYSQDIFQIIQP